MCICKPGYEFVDANFVVSKEGDGSYDCQPVVYSRCSSGTVRDSSGACVSGAAYCNNFCGATVGGTVNPSTGTCDCTTTPSVDDVCDSSCRALKPTVSCQNGMLVVTDPVSALVHQVDPASLSTDGAGALDCSVSGSNILTMSTSTGSFKGVFGAPAAVNAQLRRRQLISRELSSDPAIANPIVCMKQGDSIVFAVTNAAYPIYQKDSMLNTNPNFDYSAFRALATQAASIRAISTFPFTFTEVGTFAFTLGSSSSITVISVVPTTIACSSDTSFSALTAANLAKLGVQSNGSFVLAPAWELVIGLLLGMLGLAILVAGFLYYFRSRAWGWHEPIAPMYRLKNKSLGEPRGSKGGVWSLPLTTWHSWGGNTNTSDVRDMDTRQRKPKGRGRKLTFWEYCCGKAPVLANDDEDKFDDDFKDDDIDTAVAKKNSAESEFEDDMLIPELAKHMQEQHDKIDRQLAGQKDMMKKLRNTLRNEIDELKALLTSTALEMSSAGGSDAARVRKLRSLLLEVKANTTQHGSFDGSVQNGELRLIALGEKMQKIMSGGADSLVQEILQELASSAVSAQDQVAAALLSPTLHNLLENVASFASLVGQQVQAAAEEKRRIETSSAAFNKSLAISHVMFPDYIFSLMNQCDEASIQEDSFSDDIMSIVKAFADRCPLFSSTVLESEAVLGRSLADIIEQGENTMQDKEKMERISEFADHLAEFYETANLVLDELSKRREAATDPREQGSLLRTELINAIDTELAILSSTTQVPDLEKLLPGLLAALQDGPSVRTDRQQAASASGANDGEGRSQLDGLAIDAVINNDSLTIAQKEEMLGAQETDRMVLQNMLDIERKAQEQKHQDLLGTADKHGAPDEATLAARNAAEAAKLEASLRDGRDSKLDAAMRVEYFATIDGESAHDARVATLAVNRYAATLRCFSVRARLAYLELQAKYQRKKLDSSQRLTAAALDGPEIAALDKALEEDFAALVRRLGSERAAAIVTEDALRGAWQKNPAAINVEAEMDRLSKECGEKFRKMQEDNEKLCQDIAKMDEGEASFKMKLFETRSADYQDDDAKEALALLQKELDSNSRMCSQKCEEHRTILATEHDSLGVILSMSDAWGPSIDNARAQGQLFLRSLVGLQVFGDMRVRLALTEHQLNSEVLQIRTELALRERGATVQELQVTLKNLADAAKEGASVVAASMQAAYAKEIADEKQRQEFAVVDYERERCDAVERNAQMQLFLLLEIAKSRRAMRISMTEILVEKAKLSSALSASPTLAELSKKQMDAECMREELELQSAYNILDLESLLLATYTSEMIEGLRPSVAWAQPCVRGAGAGESRVMVEALIFDKARKRLGKQFISRIMIGLEEKRLLHLGRPAADLDKVYAEMQLQLNEQYTILGASWLKEKAQFLEMQRGQTVEKLQIHEAYAETVSVITETQEEKRHDIKAAFDTALEPVKRMERSAMDRQQVLLAQNYASSLANLNLETEEKLVGAFSICNAKLRLLYSLEDDLRLIRNSQQQTTEAIQNSNDAASMSAYLALLTLQSTRHNEASALRDEYELELGGLNAVMSAQKKKQAAFLQQRLEKKKNVRERELQSQGMSATAAAAQAAREQEADKDAEAQAAAAEIDAQAKARRKAIDDNADGGLAKIQAEYKKALSTSETGLIALQSAEKAALDARLQAIKTARQAELVASGKPLAIARKLAEREATEKSTLEGDALRLEQLNLDINLKKDVDALYIALDDQMRKGYAEEIRRSGDKQGRAQKLNKGLTEELASRTEQARHSYQILGDGWQAHSKREKESLQNRLRDTRLARMTALIEEQGFSEKEANNQLDASDKESAFLLANVLEAAKRTNHLAAKEACDAKIAALQSQQASKLKGIEGSLAYITSEGRKSAAEKVSKRRELRDRMISTAASLNKKEAKSVLDTEHELLLAALLAALDLLGSASGMDMTMGQKSQALARASEELQKEEVELGRIENEEIASFLAGRQAKLANMMQMTDCNTASMIQAVRDASQAAMKLQESAELLALRRAHDEAYAKMQERFNVHRAQEEKGLKKRLEDRRQRRTEELRKQNLTAETIAATLAQEERKLVNELAQTLKTEEDQAKSELASRTAAAERATIEREQSFANNEVKQKYESNQAAQAVVDDLRVLQEAEFKRLLEVQRADREAHEKNLKTRLAEKKQEKLRLLADKKATAEECAAETMHLAEEEHARLRELERQRADETQKALAQMRSEHEQALNAAIKEAARTETEVAAAASKSAVLATLQENLQRAEAEANAKEMKRLKDVHELNATQAAAEEVQQKGQGHMKLEERLQAKREKKNRELQAQEERARAELSSRQAAETEEREMLRGAKARWAAALQQAMSRAASAGFSGIEKEDYCLREILGSKSDPVPVAQHSEVVQEVLKARHNEETSALLSGHGEERILALKAAAETCIADKTQARIALLERLNNANAYTTDEIAAEVVALDGMYSAKQLEDEMRISVAMDPVQLRQHMDLKEKQIKEIAQKVRAYTDAGDTFVAASGSSYLEELAEYRANLEAQKEARKDSLLRERQEAEAVLRQQMDREMKVMQEQLAAEQKRVEEDLEAKKLVLLRQKEEVEKKHSEDLSELDNQEAGKIKDRFEKEHAAALDALEAERLNKKARLQDRLAKKRKGIFVADEAAFGTVAEASTLADEPHAAEADWKDKILGQKKADSARGQQQQQQQNMDPVIMKTLSGFMRQVEKKLEKLDKAMSSLGSSEHAPAAKEKQSARTLEGMAYKDNDEPAPGESLVVVKTESLHLQERARIDFGLRIASLLGLSRVRIKAASSLPVNNNVGNAFANSYAYIDEEATLYVHTNRLGSSGDVGVVMIHALSHIKAAQNTKNHGDLSNDADPAFLAIFYRSLKAMSQDLYKLSSSTTPLPLPTHAMPGAVKERGLGKSESFTRLGSFNRASSFAGDNILGNDQAPSTSMNREASGRGIGGASPIIRRDLSTRGFADEEKTVSPFLATDTGATAAKTSRSASADYFSEESLRERMVMYADMSNGAVPTDFVTRYYGNRK